MNALEVNETVLERLGAGDEIYAVEQLKQATLDCASLLGSGEEQPRQSAELTARIGDFLAASDEANERYLAALLPLVEYGGDLPLAAIPRTLSHLARETALLRQEQEWHRHAGVVVIGRLVWAMTAYALHCSRLDAIASALQAGGQSPFARAPMRTISARALRHPEAFETSAGKSWEHYLAWVSELALIRDRYPLFAAELEDALAEADLLLALLTSTELGRGVYSQPLYRSTVTRFGSRLLDPTQRRQLSGLFGVEEDDLDATIEQHYAALETDRNRIDQPPARVVGADE